jgi:predicted ATPase
MAEVIRRVRDGRLVTITGPGGIGKTRLAREVAVVVGPDFEYGSVEVDLTRIDREDGVAEAVAGQLGYADFGALVNSTGDQPTLVVLDNCEHVLDAAADVTRQLLDACEMPTIIATSRSPLDLPDESVITLGPLATPAPDVADGCFANAPAITAPIPRRSVTRRRPRSPGASTAFRWRSRSPRHGSDR